MHPKPQLVIMAKEPRAGSVKTRLARDIGTVQATSFYRHSLANLLRRLARDPRWHTIMAVTPDTAARALAKSFSVACVGQGAGDLGCRMQRLFDHLPPGPVIIIGTDIPQIAPEIIAEAFHRLRGHDAVMGPSDDGGYWLIGEARLPKPLKIFQNVRWSSKHTRDDTLENLRGKSVAKLQILRDVDEGADYHLLKSFASRRVPPHSFN